MNRFRQIAAVVCVVLMTITIPLSVIGGWAKGQLLNEQKFVGTFAPLASDPAVQVALSAEVARVISEQVDVDQVAANAFAGLDSLGLPDRATQALGLLQGPAAEGMRSVIYTGTERLITSPAFASIWESALQLSHRALLQVATNHEFAGGVLTTSESGEIAVQLGPVVAAATAELVERGYGFAGNVGEVDVEFVIAQSDALPALALVYSLSGWLGTWLPVLSIALAAAAIALSLRRRRTTLQVLLCITGVAALLLIVLAIVGAVAPGAVTAQPEASLAIGAIISQVLGGIRATLWWLFALGLTGMVATVLLWRPSRPKHPAAAVTGRAGSAATPGAAADSESGAVTATQ